MRAGYVGNWRLQRLLERGQSQIQKILEVLITKGEDIKDTQPEWSGADSITVQVLPDGGIRLAGTIDEVIVQDVSDAGADMTNLVGSLGNPVSAAVVEWNGDSVESTEIHTLQAYLDPAYGGPQEVAEWRAEAFRVRRVYGSPDGNDIRLELVRIVERVTVPAPPVVGFVDFAFATTRWIPTVGPAPTTDTTIGDSDEGVFAVPTTIFMVQGVKADGTPAANVAWLTDSTQPQAFDGAHRISQYLLHPVNAPDDTSIDSEYERPINLSGAPRLKLVSQVYTPATITFSTANPPDLGQVPLGSVECVVEGHEPGGSSIDAEISADGATWFPCADGDLVGSANDGANGSGNDLTALPLQQIYRMRMNLNPSPNGRVTPYGRRLGVRDVISVTVDDQLVMNDPRWAIDPKTLAGEVGELTVSFPKDGVRDHRSFGEDLFAENYLGDLQFRLWIGHRNLPRQYWLHVDDFEPEDIQTAGPVIEAVCLTPLARLKRRIPIKDALTQQRAAVTYQAQTPLANVYADIRDGQIGLPGRLVGDGIPTTNTDSVSRTIDEELDGKGVLDRLAWIAGGANISSQGRLKFASVYDANVPLEEFGPDEIVVTSATPGFRHRQTDLAVKFGWDPRKDDGRGTWAGEAYATADQAINTLDRALIESENDLDEEIALWIEETLPQTDPRSSALADAIAIRQVGWFGPGMIAIEFECTDYPRPHLEPGDAIVLRTDEVIGRDPNTGNEVRGPIWATGRIAIQHNPMGTQFTVWIRSYSDLSPTAVSIKRIGFADPKVERAFLDTDDQGFPRVQIQGNADVGSFKVAAKLGAPFPTEGDVRLVGASAADANGYAAVSLTGLGDIGSQEVFVSILPYEGSAGDGVEGEIAKVSGFPRGYRPQLTLSMIAWTKIDQGGNLPDGLLDFAASLTVGFDQAEVGDILVELWADFALAGKEWRSSGVATVDPLDIHSWSQINSIISPPVSYKPRVRVTVWFGAGQTGSSHQITQAFFHPHDPDGSSALRGTDADGNTWRGQGFAAPANAPFTVKEASGTEVGAGEATLSLPMRPGFTMGNVSGTIQPDQKNGTLQFANMTAAGTFQIPTDYAAAFDMKLNTNGHTLSFGAGMDGQTGDYTGGGKVLVMLRDFGDGMPTAVVVGL